MSYEADHEDYVNNPPLPLNLNVALAIETLKREVSGANTSVPFAPLLNGCLWQPTFPKMSSGHVAVSSSVLLGSINCFFLLLPQVYQLNKSAINA